jgi:hypothetical protein
MRKRLNQAVQIPFSWKQPIQSINRRHSHILQPPSPSRRSTVA